MANMTSTNVTDTTQIDRTYGIPFSVLDGIPREEFALYIRYPPTPENPSSWNLFKLKDENTHQLTALKMFVNADVDSMDIFIPHSISGMFNVVFKKIPSTGKSNTVYEYIKEDKSRVQFTVSYPSYIGYINRITDF
jgi:hypothetical protein